jgi:hypothetical protein
MEVGRVTIAGARLGVQMGMLWHHLDQSIDFEHTHRAAGSKQSKQVRRLARERLTGRMRAQVIAAVEAAEAVRARRNDIVIRSGCSEAAMPRVLFQTAGIPPEEFPQYLEDWERESKSSNDWERVPSRSIDVLPGQTMDQLREVERALTRVTERLTSLTFRVASSRESGRPPGYVHPGRGPHDQQAH